MMDNETSGIVKNRFLRGFLLASGWLLVGLAILGIILPLVPTTPFLLAAAACFFKSSSRFYTWLMANKLLGKYILDYRNKQGIPRMVKLGTLLLLWASILVSVIFFVDHLWVRIILLTIAVGVTIHIALIRTSGQADERTSGQADK